MYRPQDVRSLVETTSRPLYSAQDVRSSDMNEMPAKENSKALPQQPSIDKIEQDQSVAH